VKAGLFGKPFLRQPKGMAVLSDCLAEPDARIRLHVLDDRFVMTINLETISITIVWVRTFFGSELWGHDSGFSSQSHVFRRFSMKFMYDERPMEPLITADEAAEYLGMAPSSVRKWAREKLLPSIAYPRGKGKFIHRFRVSELKAYLATLEWKPIGMSGEVADAGSARSASRTGENGQPPMERTNGRKRTR
jgi:excisionase family DNA binding protein